MEFQYGPQPGYVPQNYQYDPRGIPEQPKEKKMGGGMKVWRVIYPVLIWLGMQIIVEVAFLIAYGMSYAPTGLEADAFEEMFNYMTGKLYDNSLMITFWADLAAIAVLMIFYLRDRFKVDRDNPMNKNGVRNPMSYVLTAFSSVAVCLFFNIVVTIIVTVAVAAFGEGITESFDNLSEAIESTPILVQILSVVIVGPVCEELVMRGLVFKRLRGDLKFIWAALISSAIFGLVHGNWVQFVYAFAIGMIAAFIYEHTRNLLAPIILHAVANGVSTLASAETLEPYFNNLMFGYTMFFTIIVCAGAAVTGMIAIKFISDNRLAARTRIK